MIPKLTSEKRKKISIIKEKIANTDIKFEERFFNISITTSSMSAIVPPILPILRLSTLKV